MKDPKFFAFAGGLGVVIIGILVGGYFLDFAPQSSHPSGDNFVAQPSAPVPHLASRPVPQAPVPPMTRESSLPIPTTNAQPTAQRKRQKTAASTTTPVSTKALEAVDRQLTAIHQDLRILTAEQSRMDQRLAQLHPAGSATSPIPKSVPLPTTTKSLSGWSVESIGGGQAWIQGPSGNTHVVQAGMTVAGFHVLAVEPDRVLTSRGTIGY